MVDTWPTTTAACAARGAGSTPLIRGWDQDKAAAHGTVTHAGHFRHRANDECNTRATRAYVQDMQVTQQPLLQARMRIVI